MVVEYEPELDPELDEDFKRCSIEFAEEVVAQLVRATMKLCEDMSHNDGVTLVVSPQVWRVVEPHLHVGGVLETPLNRVVRVVPRRS